jgi:hypothetical protein
MGSVALSENDHDLAAELHDESLVIARQLKDTQWIGDTLRQLGRLAHARGAYADAMRLLDESRAIQEGLGAQDRLARVLYDLGLSARQAGEHARSFDAHRDSLVIFHELANRTGIAEGLEQIARLSLDIEDGLRAVRLLGAAATLRPSAPEQPDEPALAELRRSLGEAMFASAWAEGRAMTVEQAVAYAVDGPDCT